MSISSIVSSIARHHHSLDPPTDGHSSIRPQLNGVESTPSRAHERESIEKADGKMVASEMQQNYLDLKRYESAAMLVVNLSFFFCLRRRMRGS